MTHKVKQQGKASISTAKSRKLKSDKKKKKASVKETLTKIAKVVKKPFAKDSKQQKQLSKQQLLKSRKEKICLPSNSSSSSAKPTKKELHLQQGDVPFAESKTMTLVSLFFCTNDEFLDNLDDLLLYESLVRQYPGLAAQETNEQVKRRAIIELLENDDELSKILKSYNMTICDFFKFLFRLCPSVFKGLFVKKVQKTLKNKQYVDAVKFGTYTFLLNRRRPSKRCSIF